MRETAGAAGLLKRIPHATETFFFLTKEKFGNMIVGNIFWLVCVHLFFILGL